MTKMRTMRTLLVTCAAAAVVLMLGTISAQAATYYVSQSTGNDSANGQSAKTPWKTLAKASTVKLAAGDSILLKCGDTWNEDLRPQGSGTAAKPILIGSYGEGGKKPIIDRQDDKQDLYGIYLKDQEGFKIVGLEFNKCMTGIYAEYSDDCPTKKYIWIEDCYFHDSLTYGGYQTYPTPKNISLGICFFSYERDKKIVIQDIMIKKCVFRRLASAIWTNSPDNFNKNASFVYNFGNLVMEDCLFVEGFQWQQGLRGVDKGAMRNCITHDVGRGFRAWNGVAGSMFFRCKDWVIENCEWGFIDIGQGSGDGEAFDWEGNCDSSVMRNCVFHDTDGPGFLLCCYSSDGNPNQGIVMENCVLNGKAKRPIRLPRCEIVNTTDWTDATWNKCRFYLSPGEALMRVMDHEKDKNSKFVDCIYKDLSKACSTPNLAKKAKAAASSEAAANKAAMAIDGKPDTFWKPAAATGEQWLRLGFPAATTVNEFKIKEGPSSAISWYQIQYYDDKAAASNKWISCFNGMSIGGEFVAPIVSRTTRGVRLVVMSTKDGNPPCISEFEAYNDTSGEVLNDQNGPAAEGKVGK